MLIWIVFGPALLRMWLRDLSLLPVCKHNSVLQPQHSEQNAIYLSMQVKLNERCHLISTLDKFWIQIDTKLFVCASWLIWFYCYRQEWVFFFIFCCVWTCLFFSLRMACWTFYFIVSFYREMHTDKPLPIYEGNWI